MVTVNARRHQQRHLVLVYFTVAHQQGLELLPLLHHPYTQDGQHPVCNLFSLLGFNFFVILRFLLFTFGFSRLHVRGKFLGFRRYVLLSHFFLLFLAMLLLLVRVDNVSF